MSYLLLWMKSCFSLRYGVETPTALAERLAETGLAGAVLADRHMLAGALEFGKACSGVGLVGIPGAEITVDGRRLVLVARSGGWPDLCTALSRSMFEDGSRIEWPDPGNGITAVAMSAADAEYLRRSGWAGVKMLVAVLPGWMGGGDPRGVEQRIIARGFEPVAAWPAMFTSAKAYRAHTILRAGIEGMALSEMPDSEFAPRGCLVPSEGDFLRAFDGCTAALAANSRMLCSSMRLPLEDLSRPPTLGEDDDAQLRRLVTSRLPTVYGRSGAARARLCAELDAIARAQLSGYFLLFGRIADYCRREGITAVARGSAAGSIVARLLGLSVVCPLRYGLSFSRFFNRLRSEPPDIDLDIDSEERERVMQWFLDSRRSQSAAVSEVVRLRKRSALRVAAAAHGMGPSEIDSLVGLLDHPRDPVWKRRRIEIISADSGLVLDLPSHLAPHPCGLVCTPGPVYRFAPIQPDLRGGRLCQMDKDGVEQIGLLKMDLLGQRALTALSIACRKAGIAPMALIRRGGPLDSEVGSLLDAGRTIGVAHVESPAMRGLLREMGIDSMEDVARALALVRPGAAGGGGRRRYLEAMRTGRRWPAPLPCLDGVLRENLGVMLYQEDVSAAAEAVLGLGEAEADLLRRRLKKGVVEKAEVLDRAAGRGIAPAVAEEVWKLLSGYAGYGFCRAHAFTFAAVACASALLRVSDPAGFFAAVLAGGGGFYRSGAYVEEARRLGVGIFPPGVNSGEWRSLRSGTGIMLGFRLVRGMGESLFERLVSGRPYRNPGELRMAGLPLPLVERIAAAGCFSECGLSEPEALWEARTGDIGLFPGYRQQIDGLAGYSRERRLRTEMGALGIAVSDSALALVPRPKGTIPLGEMPEEGTVRIWGSQITRRRLENDACFLMLGDESGTGDIFLNGSLGRRLADIRRRPRATIVVQGDLEYGGRIRAVAVEEGPAIPEPIETGSHG